MFNSSIFRNLIAKIVIDKEKPEIIRRVANSEWLTASLNFLKQRSEKVKLVWLSKFLIKRGMKYE